MTDGQVLVLFGSIFQLLGVLITAYGAAATWNKYRPEQKVLAPIIEPIERRRQKIVSILRRRFGRTKVHQASAKGVAEVAVAADASRLRKRWHELPADLPFDEAICELDYRTRDLVEKVYENDDRIAARLNELRESIDSLARSQQQQSEDQKEDIREAAAGGIRLVLLGLLTTGVGIVVMTVGSIPPVA